MKILTYTFRTYPYIDQLKQLFPDTLIFGKLNEDLNRFTQIINDFQPEIILGIAQSQSNTTHIKCYSVNKFSGGKQLVKNGTERYSLYVPNNIPITWKLCRGYGTTFCNWTMYKIADYLHNNDMTTKLMFVHTAKLTELSTIKSFLTKE